MLSKEFIAESKERLLSEKARLEKELKGLSAVDFGHDVANDDEQTSESEQLDDNQSVADEYSARLVDIDAALEKILEGTYGKCENCDKEISEKLLRIDPESRLCESCKAAAK